MLPSTQIIHIHDASTTAWHSPADHPTTSPPPEGPEHQLEQLARAQHRANFDLWHQEDEARDPGSSTAIIAAVKHEIDRLNQRRNDLVEQIDLHLISLAGEQNPAAPLHSETPGLIIDRLSILALKRYHTAEQAHRPSASKQHRERSAARLLVIEEQRSDLAHCFDQLWSEILAGRRRFKLYRQMKMYNDPELNPVLYTRR